MIFLRKTPLARRFAFGRGLLLMLSIVALWGIPALIQTHGQFFVVGIGRHVIGRSFATMEGHGADSLGMYLLLLPFYFVTIFLKFFSVVDKTAVVDPEAVGREKGRDHRSRLQRRIKSTITLSLALRSFSSFSRS